MSLFRRKKKANDEILIASFNRSNATVTDSELTEVFTEVGSRYGYADVKAKFKALKDFKVQWQRSYKWAEFTVSDYMDRAPYDVLQNLADVLFSIPIYYRTAVHIEHNRNCKIGQSLYTDTNFCQITGKMSVSQTP